MSYNNNNLLQEQVRLIYKQLPAIMIVPSSGALILSALHWGHIAQENIVTWFVLVFILSSVSSSALHFSYCKFKESKISTEFWANCFNVLGLCSGLAWGASAYYIFAEDNIVLQLILILYLFSASALIALTMTAYRPAFYMVVGPMLISIAIRLMMENDFIHILLAVTTIIYIISLFVFHYHVNQGFEDSIRLWFEKDELAHELKLRSIESEKENLAKSRFLAAASHDLRQPLIAQDLLLDTLKYKLNNDDNNELFLKLKSNIASLHSLFNELVEVSKIDTGNVLINKTSIDMEQLMHEVEGQFLPISEAKNIGLNINKYSIEIYTDKILLKRILQNIISNAIKYTHKGGVTVSQDLVENELRIVIEDTGIGIDDSDQKSIFDEFYRSSDAAMHSDGFGLGLAIVKRLATLLDFDLQLESDKGIGTRFLIAIPLQV